MRNKTKTNEYNYLQPNSHVWSYITQYHDKYRHTNWTLSFTNPTRRVEIAKSVHEHESYRYLQGFRLLSVLM